jgi:hypothetical protein
MRAILAPVLTALLFGHSPPATSAPAERCQWVDGRLSAYNGTPTFRIWPKGTKRLLGIIGRSGAPEGDDLLPAKVWKLKPSFSRDLWGSFRVCPQSPEHAGWMSLVVVTKARGIIAKKR